MDQLWRTAPTPAVHVALEAGACRPTLNPAAEAWGQRVGLIERDWQQLAERALASSAGPLATTTDGADLALDLDRLPRPLACRRVACPGGWLLWLTPDSLPHSRWLAPTEQIALMQDIGRMGLVVRDTVTGEGFWDAQVYRMLGLAPAAGGSPALAQALERVHPDDVGLLRETDTVLKQGRERVSIRFRVVWPDGTLRHIKAFTELRRDPASSHDLVVTLLVDDTELVDRDQQQRQTSELLGRALRLAGISVWEVDPDLRNIRFVDQGTGLQEPPPAQRAMALDRMRETVHPDDVQSMRRSADEALAGHQVVDTVTRFKDGQGGWKHLLTRRVARRDAQGRVTALMGVALDLSELVRQREISLTLTGRMELAAETLGVGFWSRDVKADTVEWDSRMYQLYGRRPEEGAPPLDEWLARHVHPDDAQRMARRAKARWDHRSPAVQETFRIRLPDGGERWIQGWTRRLLRDGQTVDFGLHMDVTERRQAELRSERERERDRFAIESAGIGVWERGFDGRPSYWSPTMYRLRGLMPGDPRPLQELVALTAGENDVAEADRRMARCVELGETYRHEFSVRWPDGTERWLASTGRAVRDAGGQVVALAGVNVDITERQLASALTRERDRAEQASAAKSGLMARVSHELRTPMNAVLGFAELMAQDALAPLAPRQAERLSHIRSAGIHLLGLIDDLLELSRAEAGGRPMQLEAVALNDLLQESLQWVAGLAGQHGVRVEAEGGLGGPAGSGEAAAALAGMSPGVVPGVVPAVLPAVLPGVVMADRRRLGQVMVNLLTNGIKYNRVGGQVRIRAQPAQLQGGPAWELCVSDDGRGLSSEQVGRLFEPFNRLGVEREGIPGTGIGLSIVRQLVQDMGGRLAVDSEPGRGSEFRVCLPALMGGLATALDAVLDAPATVATGSGAKSAPLSAASSAASSPVHAVPDAAAGSAAASRVNSAVRASSVFAADAADAAGGSARGAALADSPPSLAVSSAPAAPPLRIVYVEDNPVNEMLVREMLSLRPGVVLETAPDGRSGMASVLALRPEVVLLDLQLPDLSGLEVLRLLRQEPTLTGCSFVALSANAMPDDVRHALAQGFDDYWTKPLDLLRFLAAIDALALHHGCSSSEAAVPVGEELQGASRSFSQVPASKR